MSNLEDTRQPRKCLKTFFEKLLRRKNAKKFTEDSLKQLADDFYSYLQEWVDFYKKHGIKEIYVSDIDVNCKKQQLTVSVYGSWDDIHLHVCNRDWFQSRGIRINPSSTEGFPDLNKPFTNKYFIRVYKIQLEQDSIIIKELNNKDAEKD